MEMEEVNRLSSTVCNVETEVEVIEEGLRWMITAGTHPLRDHQLRSG